MIKLVGRLWRGAVPLTEAFWYYAVGYGLLLNLATSMLFMAVLVKNGSPALLVASFVLPIPYNFLIVVAVWRSAGRYAGPKQWAELARVACVIWMILLTAA